MLSIPQLAAVLSATVTILTVLFTRTVPWIRSRYLTHAVRARMGAELIPLHGLERAIRYYVPPLCQNVDPGSSDEPALDYDGHRPLFAELEKILADRAGYKYVVVLADSAMGKSSALINYYARNLRKAVGRQRIVLIPLNIPDADTRIAAVEDKTNTILFLDGLDEDVLAQVDHAERTRMLVSATREFKRVVVTCRTQFFVRDDELPKSTGVLKVGPRGAGESAEHYFHRVYISPFTPKQVNQYLRKRYPVWRFERRYAARQIVAKVPSLSVRPMLLAHIDDLIHGSRDVETSYDIYEQMVDAWLERERGYADPAALRAFSEHLAIDLMTNRQHRGAERIPYTEIRQLAEAWKIDIEDWKLTGRSLLNRDAEGNYKFAHRSIMEYLAAKSLVERDNGWRLVEWTDQMRTFAGEMLFDAHNRLRLLRTDPQSIADGLVAAAPGNDGGLPVAEQVLASGLFRETADEVELARLRGQADRLVLAAFRILQLGGRVHRIEVVSCLGGGTLEKRSKVHYRQMSTYVHDADWTDRSLMRFWLKVHPWTTGPRLSVPPEGHVARFATVLLRTRDAFVTPPLAQQLGQTTSGPVLGRQGWIIAIAWDCRDRTVQTRVLDAVGDLLDACLARYSWPGLHLYEQADAVGEWVFR